MDRAERGCENCSKVKPNKIIFVTDVYSPHCLYCGKAILSSKVRAEREGWEKQFEQLWIDHGEDKSLTNKGIYEKSKSFIRQILASQKQAIWEIMEGMKLVMMRQELKTKNGVLIEVGKNVPTEPDNYVKGFNQALSDVQERIKRI